VRIFIYDGREIPDPDPAASVDEIKRRLTDFFPELANAEVKKTEKDGNEYYELVRKVGTKG
jgi:PRTRC genetic system protein C